MRGIFFEAFHLELACIEPSGLSEVGESGMDWIRSLIEPSESGEMVPDPRRPMAVTANWSLFSDTNNSFAAMEGDGGSWASNVPLRFSFASLERAESTTSSLLNSSVDVEGVKLLESKSEIRVPV